MKEEQVDFHLKHFGQGLVELNAFHEWQIRVGDPSKEESIVRVPVYFCPLCMKNIVFKNDGELLSSSDFDIDHFPPRSVGGTNAMLVCKECNSFFGRECDYALKEYLAFKAFAEKREGANYSMKVSYPHLPGKYRIKSSWEDGKWVQDINLRNYQPIKEWLLDKEKKLPFDINMHFQVPAEYSIHRALLKAAYLACFARFGFEFAMSHTGIRLRSILFENEKHPLPNLAVFGDAHPNLSPSTDLYYIHTPESLQSFVVFLDMRIKDVFEERAFVVIPGYNQSCWNVLESFRPMIRGGDANFILSPIDRQFVLNGEYFGFSKTWASMVKNAV